MKGQLDENSSTLNSKEELEKSTKLNSENTTTKLENSNLDKENHQNDLIVEVEMEDSKSISADSTPGSNQKANIQ